jgi:hypothetical protein
MGRMKTLSFHCCLELQPCIKSKVSEKKCHFPTLPPPHLLLKIWPPQVRFVFYPTLRSAHLCVYNRKLHATPWWQSGLQSTIQPLSQTKGNDSLALMDLGDSWEGYGMGFSLIRILLVCSVLSWNKIFPLISMARPVTNTTFIWDTFEKQIHLSLGSWQASEFSQDCANNCLQNTAV